MFAEFGEMAEVSIIFSVTYFPLQSFSSLLHFKHTKWPTIC